MYTLAIILKLVYAGGLRHLESRIFKMTFRRRGVKLLFYSCDIDFDLLKLYACYKKYFMKMEVNLESVNYLNKKNIYKFQIQSTD